MIKSHLITSRTPLSRSIGQVLSAGGGFAPASLFSSNKGFIWDGSPGASDFFENSDLTSPATVSGSDPVGSISDTSGNHNDGLQITSLERPTYYIDGNGIRSWQIGEYSGATHWLKQEDISSAITITPTAALTVVAVYKYTDTANATFIAATGQYGTGGYFGMLHLQNSPDNKIRGVGSFSNSNATLITGATLGGAGAMVEFVRTGTGTNQTSFATHALDGTLIDSSVSTQDATPLNAIINGFAPFTGAFGQARMAFFMAIDRALSTDEMTDLRAYLTTKFGSW